MTEPNVNRDPDRTADDSAADVPDAPPYDDHDGPATAGEFTPSAARSTGDDFWRQPTPLSSDPASKTSPIDGPTGYSWGASAGQPAGVFNGSDDDPYSGQPDPQVAPQPYPTGPPASDPYSPPASDPYSPPASDPFGSLGSAPYGAAQPQPYGAPQPNPYLSQNAPYGTTTPTPEWVSQAIPGQSNGQAGSQFNPYPPNAYPPASYPPVAYPAYPPQTFGVSPFMPYASWGKRFKASLFDIILPSLVLAPLLLPIFGVNINDPGGSSGGSLLQSLIQWTLLGVLWGAMSGTTGQTPGRKWARTQLVGEDGNPIGFGKTVAHYALHTIDGMLCGVGFLWPLWDAKRQTFSDKILKTYVIDLDQVQGAQPYGGQPWTGGYPPVGEPLR